MRVRYHYRPVQHLVLAALALCWLALLVLAFAGQLLAASSDLAARGVTTAQAQILTRPVAYSERVDQHVWRVR